MKFHIFVAVWGAGYIDTLVKLTVPTLLYERNLPFLASRHECKVVFFIRAREEQQIRSAPSIIRLAALVPVEYVHFDPDAAPNVYLAMSDAHHRGGVIAREARAKVIIVSPDCLMADGALAKVSAYAESGKVAVMCAAPRLLQDTAAAALEARIDTPILPREMVALTLQYLHPEMRRYFVDSPDFSTFPAVCCWDFGARGVLMRLLHLHPLMIDFAKLKGLDALHDESIDGDLLGRALSDWSDIHIETDSDNIGMCSLTPSGAWYSESLNQPFDVERLRAMAHGPMVNSLHRYFFTKAIKLHVDDLDDDWRRLEESTAWVAAAIQAPPAALPAPARRGLVRGAMNGIRRLLVRSN